MSNITYYGTASASATATITSSATATSSATSSISQQYADNLALESAQILAIQTAQSDVSQNIITSTVYVALLFTQNSYNDGILDTLELIKNEFPNSKLVFEQYIVDGTILKTDETLTDFVNKYPTGNRVTISELTSILNEILNYFEKHNLNIFSLSVNATSLLFQKKKNLFTYGYYLDKSVMSSFYIITDYGLQNIVILIDNKSVNFTFLNSYSDIVQKQNSLLDNLPVTIYDLSDTTQTINIQENSFIYLFADTSEITSTYINKITNALVNNTTSCIYMTNINYNIGDIFGNIPAFVTVLCPVNYTTTSNKVYLNLKNKIKYSYEIYSFYDILYSLQFISDNNLEVTNNIYISVSPFQNIPEAYSNSLQLDGLINGFNFGSYNIIFTKNSILNTPELVSLYNKYNLNDGTIYRLPDSQSLFLTAGIVPFYQCEIYFWIQPLIKIYNNETLTYLKYDGNSTKDNNNNFIAVSQQIKPKFIVSYDSISGLFSFLEKIYTDPTKTNPQVNLRMSKVDDIFYL
jgi:hypothetical protein